MSVFPLERKRQSPQEMWLASRTPSVAADIVEHSINGRSSPCPVELGRFPAAVKYKEIEGPLEERVGSILMSHVMTHPNLPLEQAAKILGWRLSGLIVERGNFATAVFEETSLLPGA